MILCRINGDSVDSSLPLILEHSNYFYFGLTNMPGYNTMFAYFEDIIK